MEIGSEVYFESGDALLVEALMVVKVIVCDGTNALLDTSVCVGIASNVDVTDDNVNTDAVFTSMNEFSLSTVE